MVEVSNKKYKYVGSVGKYAQLGEKMKGRG
jgi:hypothetical protein